ncbi:MAG TPA: DUF5916 domain-containing protein [Candidatus Polarisedimenticolia bacterium]|nr:DUF5916 domain-containing protein [Candidatus Polarisedimenticolia bacterium]
MKSLVRRALPAIALLAAGPGGFAFAQQAPPAATPTVRVGLASAPIQLDGRLDEPDWALAGVILELTQQSPVPGGPMPYHTTVRLLTDGSTLYVGVRAFDPQPGRIAIHTMQRDGDLNGDDTIALALDTFGDHRTGYFFQVNAAGARYDGLISDFETISPDWDGIWDAHVSIDDEGWTLEVAIPGPTLRFTPGDAPWGLNVERRVARDRTVMRWTGTTLDARNSDMRRAGLLEGAGSLRQGIGLSMSPYGLVRTDTDDALDDTDTTGDAGADVAYNLSEQLSGVLTVNTDFAETEVDTRQVNLTRFPLFFPEKRYFFVEGANQFVFGLGLNSDFVPFFSRRVGLFEGERVPIDYGAKIIGRQGKWGIGVLDVKTGDIPSAPSTNLFAGRVTYDVDRHLRIGAIGTRGDPDGVSDNWLGGADAVWQTSELFGDKNFSVGGWIARTGGDPPEGNPGGQPGGWGFKVDYPNDLWDNTVLMKVFGDSLDPALGFLPRPGIRLTRGATTFAPRPQSEFWAAHVRQFYFGAESTYITDHTGDVESWEVTAYPLSFVTPAGGSVDLVFIPTYERLDAPFEIAPGVVLPIDEYHFLRSRLTLATRPDRPVSTGGYVDLGSFYDGRLSELQGYVRFASSTGALQTELNGLHVQGQLPEGDFITTLWQVKTAYAFSPDLVLSFNGQYDNVTRNIGVNARLRYTIHPGADLYVVWTRGWLHPPDAERPLEAEPLDSEAVVKLRWTFRM